MFCTNANSWRCCTYTHSESPYCSDMLSRAVEGRGRPPVAGAAQVPWLGGPAIRRPFIQKLVIVGTVQVVGTPVAASMQAEYWPVSSVMWSPGAPPTVKREPSKPTTVGSP